MHFAINRLRSALYMAQSQKSILRGQDNGCELSGRGSLLSKLF